MHLGTILAAVGSLDILTEANVHNRPLPLFTFASLLLLPSLPDITTGILPLRTLNLSRIFLPCTYSGASVF